MIGNIKHYVKLFFTAAGKWRYARIAAAGLVLISAVIPVLNIALSTHAYALSAEQKSLVGTPNSNLTAKLQYDNKEHAWLFNNLEKPGSKEDIAEMLRAQVGGGGKNDTTLYSAKVPEDAKKGITYTDNESHLSFTLKPQFKKGGGKLIDNRLIYPMADGAKAVYTIKSNGLKEDIILDKNIGDELTYTYKLDLPKELTAKLQADGTVGIYSVSPLLYTAKASGDMDAAKLKNARETAPKDYLAFGLPAPVIIDSAGKHVPGSFSLAGDTLTVHARGLAKLSYPLTIDPSVVITSSSDFTSGNNEGMISYSTADQITRGSLTGGSLGSSWTGTTGLGAGRTSMGTVTYNGYMYVIGGNDGVSSMTETRYASVGSSGTIGSWTTGTPLPQPREYMSAVAYNGYMYVIGGSNTNTGSVVNTSYVAPINSDGSLGTWTTTTALSTARAGHGMVAYGGYMYVIGGSYGMDWSDGTDSVQYAPINANGTLGTWSATTALSGGARQMHATTVYNGYLYTFGGMNTSESPLSSVARAPIRSDGTIGSWITETAYPAACTLGSNAAVMYNGYVYIAGGWCGSHTATVRYAPITANGSIGSWTTTTSLPSVRIAGGLVAANNYLFVIGGSHDDGGDGLRSDVASTAIQDPGVTTPFTTSGNTFAATRRGAQTVVYNGYMYVMGGDNGSTPVNTVYYAAIAADGTIGSFSSTNAFTTARTYFTAVAYNGYMYVMGGCSSAVASCGTASNSLSTVYRAPINSNGTIGTWTNTNNNNLAEGIYGMSAVAYNGYMYVMGGLNGGTSRFTVRYHAISTTDGSMSGTWSATTNMPSARYYHQAVAYGGKLYIVGGCSVGVPTCTSSSNAVSYASFNSDGTLGSFTSTTAFSTARSDFGLATTNGRLYITGGYNNTNYYNDTQSAPINSDGSVGTWSTISGATLATARYGIGMASANGNLYVTGGYNGSTYYNNVQIARINNGGSGQAGSWSTDSTDTFTGGRTEAQTVTYNGYLYVLGGRNGASYLNTVQFAPLNTDGTVGVWTAGSNFTTGRSVFSAAAMNGYMYILGGRNGASTYLKDVQYAKINADGSLGAWASAGSNVFNGGQGSCVVAYNGYIYSLGGWDGSTDHNSVRYALQNAGGTIGSWQTANSFTGGRSNLNCVANGGYIYISGGENNVGTNDVQYAQINSNGSLGTWGYTTGYNLGRVNHAMFTYNGFMYIAGGQGSTGGGSDRNDMQYAPINSNGTLGEWRHTSPIDNSSAMDMAVYNGYVYAPSQVTGATSTRYAKLDSIARKGTYSKLIDLGVSSLLTGVTYSGTLPGGNLQISYRTADDDGAFGELKNVQYPGLADACTGIYGAARYVWLTVALDDSTSGTFGETNLANLTDISLVYSPKHPDPQYRLRGGKSLIAGVKSPLDTCGS